ncbi:MAG: gamma-D-glutamyl-meso-diaminopimelate peptidase, partial [Clostridiales bacterium]|nr:gamma-D-glutamyl-meso-diaminopimelate peptidase [Clostridiales bacterium]
NTPERSYLMAKILAASSEYKLVKNEGLCSHGGFKDWFIEEFSRPAFTVEMGLGKNPLPLSDFEDIYKKIEEMLLLSVLM